VDQALGVDPAERMFADVELPGIVGNDDRAVEEALGADCSPQRALGGDRHRVGVDLQPGDAELVEMGLPCGGVGEMPRRVFNQSGDDRTAEIAAAHVRERLVVKDILTVASAQQPKKAGAAFRSSGGEKGEGVIADLGAEAIFALVPGAGIIHRNPVGMGQSGTQYVLGLGDEGVVGLGQNPHHLPLGDVQPQPLQQRYQTRHGRLALVVLSKDKAFEFGAKVGAYPRRQRRHHRASIRRQPAFPAMASMA